MDIIEEYVGPAKDMKKVNPQWWNLDKSELASSLVPLVDDIEKRQSYRQVQNLRHAMLYANQEMWGMYPGMYAAPSSVGAFSQFNAGVTLNVIRACIDTVASKIGTVKPRPFFLTEAGNNSMQTRAKKLNKFMDGQFQAMGIYPTKRRSFVDSCVFGTGATKLFRDKDANGKDTVSCERVHIHELIVDDADGLYGEPAQLHQIKYVNRWKLISLFPKSEQAIKGLPGGITGNDNGSPSNKDVVKVYESWKLPSRLGAKDGRHVIAINGATLAEREYKRMRFPFVFDRWNQRTTGFFGSGIAEENTGVQLEITKLMRAIQKAQHLACVPRVFQDITSEVNGDHINNEFGGIVKFKGTPPIFNTAPGMAPEVYQYVIFLYEKAFEQVGISMLSAASKKPSGLNAAVAMREYQDIESERFKMIQQRYEESFLDAAEIIIDIMQEIVEDGGNPEVIVSPDGGGSQQIKWKEINLTRDQYIMRLFPTSLFPTEPAAKLQTITEYIQAGWLDKDMSQNLLEFPDLKAYTSLSTSNVNLINRLIENMTERGEYEPPEPYFDLQRCKQMTQLAYARAKLDKVPEANLELLRRFISDTEALIQQGMTPANPAGPIPGSEQPVTAKPEALPVSALLPQGAPAPQGAMNGVPV